MPRKLSPEHQLELESLHTVAATIAAWCDALTESSPGVRLADAVERAYEARDLRGLRMARNDLVEMTNAGTAEQAHALDALLRQRANTTLEQLHAKKMERIRRIRARGKLTSEEQYYLVREHVEFITAFPERAEEVDALLAMIHAYQDRAIRNQSKE